MFAPPLAALPDLDLAYPSIHRTMTHSVGASRFCDHYRDGRDRVGHGADQLADAADLRRGVGLARLLLDWLGARPESAAWYSGALAIQRRLVHLGVESLSGRAPHYPAGIVHPGAALSSEVESLGPIVQRCG